MKTVPFLALCLQILKETDATTGCGKTSRGQSQMATIINDDPLTFQVHGDISEENLKNLVATGESGYQVSFNSQNQTISHQPNCCNQSKVVTPILANMPPCRHKCSNHSCNSPNATTTTQRHQNTITRNDGQQGWRASIQPESTNGNILCCNNNDGSIAKNNNHNSCCCSSSRDPNLQFRIVASAGTRYRDNPEPMHVAPSTTTMTFNHGYGCNKTVTQTYNMRDMFARALQLFIEVFRQAVNKEKFISNINQLIATLEDPTIGEWVAVLLEAIFRLHDNYGNQGLMLEMLKHPQMFENVFNHDRRLTLQRSCGEYATLIFDHICRGNPHSLDPHIVEFCHQRNC